MPELKPEISMPIPISSQNIMQQPLALENGRKYKTTPSIFRQYGSSRPSTISFVKNDPNAESHHLTTREEILAHHPYYKMNHYRYLSLRMSFKEAGILRVGPKELGDDGIEDEPDDLDLKWNIFWGRHLLAEQYQLINAFQKVNHFPGSTQLGRKDFLNVNLSRMLYKFGPQEYGFFPQTYLLPYDQSQLEKRMARASADEIFILKPFASSCGRGISLMKPSDPIPMKQYLVQQYIHNPFLINGHKFDLRLYVCATSMDPLRLYIHDDGLVRFATQKYDTQSLDTRLAHLTNYSLNKNSSNFVKNKNAEEDTIGHKWSLRALKKYMDEHIGQEKHQKLWSDIHDLIVKTVISVEDRINTKTKQQVPHDNACYELYGFDVMFDTDLKPWLIEVNILPSLACASPLDKKIKSEVLTQMFHLLGVIPYDRNNYDNEVKRLLRYDSDRLSPDHYILQASEDELSRCGKYTRIFPPVQGDPRRYNHLFTTPRYNNELLIDFELQKRNGNIERLHASIA
jgi:hypothetical protein